MSSFVAEVLNESTGVQMNLGVYKAKYAYRAAQKSQRKASGLVEKSECRVRITDEKSRQTLQDLSKKCPTSKQAEMGFSHKVVSQKVVLLEKEANLMQVSKNV